MWAEPGLFYLFLSFSQCNTDMAQNLTILKRKWCAWDSNLGLQEDWHLWIHWAMSGPCMAYSSIEFFLKKPLVNLPIVLASKNSQNLVRRERFDLCVKPLWPWTKMMMILLLSFKIFFCQFRRANEELDSAKWTRLEETKCSYFFVFHFFFARFDPCPIQFFGKLESHPN